MISLLQKKGINLSTLKKFHVGYYNGNKLYGNVPPIMHQLKSKWGNMPRLVFPIYNVYNELITIGYRTDKIKFFYETSINNSNDPLFFGLNYTYENIINTDELILVEGIFDFLILYQFGIHNVVCNLGTSINPYKFLYLSRFTKSILVAFDNDPAGKLATKKIECYGRKYNVSILDLKLPIDPDEYILFIKKEGFLKWIQFIKTNTQKHVTTPLNLSIKEK